MCEVLGRRGYLVIDLDVFAREAGLIVGRDEARRADEVDIDALRKRLVAPAKLAFLRAHYSHWMDANVAIVLRCRPSVLRERLVARGWPEAKVAENVEAEALDVILQEAVGRIPSVFEVDTTSSTPSQAADATLAILSGKTQGHAPGSLHWDYSEVKGWY